MFWVAFQTVFLISINSIKQLLLAQFFTSGNWCFKRKLKRVPVKLTSKEELDDCIESFIEVDFDDLIDWIDEYFEDEE